MYNTLKAAINGGEYQLTAMTRKIDTLWAARRITDEQRTELQELAIEKLDPRNERPDFQRQLEYLAALIAALTERVTALEGGGTDSDSAAYPDWQQPIAGLTTNYQLGAIVRLSGKLWKNIYTGGQNVWEPGVVGTEQLWVEYDGEEGVE